MLSSALNLALCEDNFDKRMGEYVVGRIILSGILASILFILSSNSG